MTYHLRDIPDDLWVKVKQRCHGEGRKIRSVIVMLLEQYVMHGLGSDDYRDRFTRLTRALAECGIVVGETTDGTFVIHASRPPVPSSPSPYDLTAHPRARRRR